MATRPLPTTFKIQPPRAWPSIDAGEIWAFRDLLVLLGQRDLSLRYRQTALGVVWVVLQPLLGALILAFVFGSIAKLPSKGSSYLTFVFASLIGWNLFYATLTRATASLVSHAYLLGKVYFPRMVLPLSTALLSLVDLGISLLCLFVMLAIDGVPVMPRAAASVPCFVGLLVLALGGGLFLGSLAVRFRDVNAALPVVLQLLFYASPVAYGAEIVPERYSSLFMLNPVAPLLEGLRWSFLGAGWWSPEGILYSLVFGVGLVLVGALVLRRTEQYFADVA